MYKAFRAQNFRGFRELNIQDLDRFNLIAGRNNTGKTALMEAMYIHSGNRLPRTFFRMDRFSSFEFYMLRQLRGITNPFDITIWTGMFNDFKVSEEIVLTAEFLNPPKLVSDGQHSVTLRIKQISPEDSDYVSVLRKFDAEDEGDVHILEFDISEDIQEFHLLLTDDRIRSTRSNAQSIIPSDFLHTRTPTDREQSTNRFSDLRQARRDNVLAEALIMVEPRLEGLEILYDEIHADIGLDRLISLSSQGDGMNRIADSILAMHGVSNGVIFIDEIENGLHFSAQRQLWEVIAKIARDLDIQVFATTHSLEMIRAAHEAFSAGEIYDLRLHRLDRNSSTGDIEAVTYNKFGMDAVAAFDFNFEVRG